MALESQSYVKNLGQVAAVVFLDTPPTNQRILWYDIRNGVIKFYDPNVGDWISLTQSLTEARNIDNETLAPVGAQNRGFVYASKDGTVLQFRTLIGGEGVHVTTTADGQNIVISLGNYLNTDVNSILFSDLMGEQKVLQIRSNINWEIIPGTGSTWFTLSQNSGSGILAIFINSTQNNTSLTSRSATLVIRDIAGNLPDISVTLTQQGSTSYSLSWASDNGTADLTCEQSS